MTDSAPRGESPRTSNYQGTEMNEEEMAKKMVADAGGKVDADSVMHLPDGSGCFTASFPLPKTHWLTADGYNNPPMPFRMGEGAERSLMAEKIRAAAKYAIRASTMNGKEEDFDPDAMVQNMIVGLLGYWTADGLSSDGWANPDPVPPLEAAWPIKGVRVEGETVVVSVKGGNDAARWLCGELVSLIDAEPPERKG